MKKKLMAVVAHPDDETFGMGGTLAVYASRGVEVHLICATRGEVGEVDPQMLVGFGSIGDLREHELCCAADKLGLQKVHFLGYRDSGMPNTPENAHPDALIQALLDRVAEKISLHIRQIKPQVLITFDPVGGYMHPDHVTIHNATVRAFYMAADPRKEIEGLPPFQPPKMYFHIFPRTFLKVAVRLLPLFGKDPKKYGKNEDIDLTAILTNGFPVHAKIDYRKVAKKREQASACHASQGGDRQSGYILTGLLRQISASEAFMRAYPVQAGSRVEKDLFQGI